MKDKKENTVSNEDLLEAIRSQGKQIDSLKTSNTVILEAVISLQGQVSAIQANYATKDFVEITVEKVVAKAVKNVKEELLAEIRPIGRAVDKDAVTILNHERRITRLERQMA